MDRSLPPDKFRKRNQVTAIPSTLSQMQIKKLADKYLFNEKEVAMIKKRQLNILQRFDKFADKGVLRPKQFKDSLGIMGLESFLSDRIFSLIDEDNDERISFEDFVRYISILLNGSGVEKALWSFKLLSNSKNILEIEDFEKMIFEMCYLWNSMTGSKSIPEKEFVQDIFAVFDTDNDGIVSFEEFNQVYSDGIQLIGWFEFLNNEDVNLNKVKQEWDNSLQNKNARKRTIIQRGAAFNKIKELHQLNEEEANQEELKAQLKIISLQLQECMEMVRLERDQQNQTMNNRNMLSFLQTETQIQRKFKGPQFQKNQAPSMWGDDDPEASSPTLNMSFIEPNDRFQVQMMAKLRQIIKLSEEIKRINKTLTLQSPTQHKSKVHRQLSTELKASKSRRMSVMKLVEAEDENDTSLSPQKSLGFIQQEGVRKNLSIYFGHENWNLVLNMMVGIRKAIKSLHPLNDNIQVTENHFNMKYQFEIVTKRTADFDFTKSSIFYEYAPMIFERIRKLYGVQNDDYLRSVGPEQLLGDLLFGNLSSLTEKVSSGKSGSFFYYSFDDKYMLKTISRDEFLFFKKIIKKYYEHLLVNFNSLIIKIFGLYKMKMMKSKTKQEKIYFVVMVNIFCTDFEIRERYDLKGSLYGRSARSKKNPNPDIGVPLKDIDWIDDKRMIKLKPLTAQILRKEIDKDLAFFDSNRIIDYSFLIGYAPVSQQVVNQNKVQQNVQLKRFYEMDNGGVQSSDQKFLYFFGIIDIFTEFNTKKQVEHNLKSAFISKDISCIPPHAYAERFNKFILQYIL